MTSKALAKVTQDDESKATGFNLANSIQADCASKGKKTARKGPGTTKTSKSEKVVTRKTGVKQTTIVITTGYKKREMRLGRDQGIVHGERATSDNGGRTL